MTFRTSHVATIALAAGLLVAAGSGGAVAGAMITGKQIKNNTVTTKDIKNDSLTGVDIANGSLGLADLDAALQAKLNAIGTPGAAPVPQVLSAPRAVRNTVQVGPNASSTLEITCQAGEILLGALAWWHEINDAVQVTHPVPVGTLATSARAYYDNPRNASTGLTISGTCAKVN